MKEVCASRRWQSPGLEEQDCKPWRLPEGWPRRSPHNTLSEVQSICCLVLSSPCLSKLLGCNSPELLWNFPCCTWSVWIWTSSQISVTCPIFAEWMKGRIRGRKIDVWLRSKWTIWAEVRLFSSCLSQNLRALGSRVFPWVVLCMINTILKFSFYA